MAPITRGPHSNRGGRRSDKSATI